MPQLPSPREAVFSVSSPLLVFPFGPGEGPRRAREPRLSATPTGSVTQQGTLLGGARKGAGGRGAGRDNNADSQSRRRRGGATLDSGGCRAAEPGRSQLSAAWGAREAQAAVAAASQRCCGTLRAQEPRPLPKVVAPFAPGPGHRGAQVKAP